MNRLPFAIRSLFFLRIAIFWNPLGLINRSTFAETLSKMHFDRITHCEKNVLKRTRNHLVLILHWKIFISSQIWSMRCVTSNRWCVESNRMRRLRECSYMVFDVRVYWTFEMKYYCYIIDLYLWYTICVA